MRAAAHTGNTRPDQRVRTALDGTKINPIMNKARGAGCAPFRVLVAVSDGDASRYIHAIRNTISALALACPPPRHARRGPSTLHPAHNGTKMHTCIQTRSIPQSQVNAAPRGDGIKRRSDGEAAHNSHPPPRGMKSCGFHANPSTHCPPPHRPQQLCG